MNKYNATPRPWTCIYDEIREEKTGVLLTTMHKHLSINGINQSANAELIVKAVNERDELIEALKCAYAVLNGAIMPDIKEVIKNAISKAESGDL